MIPPAFTYVTHVFELYLTLTLQGDGELLVCPWIRPFCGWGWGMDSCFAVALEMLDPTS